MSPWVAALPLFFAARALPLSLRTFLAPSTSPSDSSSARFTSIIPAAVSSRSCLIFSIVLAKVLLLLSNFVILVWRLLFDAPGLFCLGLFRLGLRVGRARDRRGRS